MRRVFTFMHGMFTRGRGGCAHGERLVFGDFEYNIGGCAESFDTEVFV